MSNVLIGIIGVILFIGLALAGALILGDDFKTANSGTRAAAILSQGRQIQHALSMYYIKTGSPLPYTISGARTTTSDLMPRFLKPFSNEFNWHFHSINGAAFASTEFIQDEQSRLTCLEVQRQAGIISDVENELDTHTVGASDLSKFPFGCGVTTINGEPRYQFWVIS